MEKGIDISYWQGNVDFAKVAKSVDFVILREGYRKAEDKRFYEYVNGCKANKIPIKGVYHFCYATTAKGAEEEAAVCLEHVAKAGLGKDVIVFFDFEYDTVKKAAAQGVHLGKNECIAFSKAFCTYVQKQGYKAGIYANLDYYRNMYDPDVIKPYVFWLADYSGGPDVGCIYHQYTDSGSISGINGNVDMNYYYSSSTDNKEDTTVGRTAQDYLNIFRDWIGYNESNGLYKKIIDLYNSYKPLPRGYAVKYSDEWCDTTVSAAGIAADVVNLIGRECGCEEHVKIFMALGIWNEDGTITPQPGYIIVYNWDKATQPNDGYSDHIGVVESVSNGQITCIEGNKGEAVARRVLSVGNGYIRGYASPKFAKSSSGSGSSSVPLPTPSTGDDINRTVAWYGVVNTGSLNVRTWAGTENAQLKSYPTIPQGTKVGVCDTLPDKDGDPWYFVKISGNQGDKYGFVSAMYITKQTSSAPDADTTIKDDGVITKTPQWVGKVTADKLNVRTWAGVNNPIIKSWPQLGYGNLVDVCDVVNAADGSRWYYIRIDGRIYGFVHSAYIAKV